MTDTTFARVTDIGKITFDAYEDARAENGEAPSPRVWNDLPKLEQECWRFAGVRAAEHVLRIRALQLAGLPIPPNLP